MEGLGPHFVIFCKTRKFHPFSGFKPEDLQGPVPRINQPEILDLMPSVDEHLLNSVITCGTRRKNLTNPIRYNREPILPGPSCKPLFPPPGEVWNKNILSTFDFRFIKDYPPAWATSSKSVRWSYFSTQRKCSIGVLPRRSRGNNKLTVNDLSDHIFRNAIQVFIGRCFLCKPLTL